MDEQMACAWTCRDRTLELTGRTRIMGILNATPDSFYDGGRYNDPEAAVERGLRLIEEGAEMIDIGGESSRPGAGSVPESEELARVLPVIEGLRNASKALLSIDTSKTAVARGALEAGAHIINDITAGRAEADGMLRLAREYGAGVVLMHMQGEPRTMQKNPAYHDVVAEVQAFLESRRAAAESAGVSRSSIVLDPGIGFGKTCAHNWELLSGLSALTELGSPLLVGLSRKRFLGELCGRPVAERLPASLAALTHAVLGGASIIRVHDVKESCDAARVADRLRSKEGRNRCGT